MHTITQSSTAGSDALAAAAAALASTAVAINGSRPALAAQALSLARQLYAWASLAGMYNTTSCGTVAPCAGSAVPLQGLWTAGQAAGGDAGTGPAEVPWVAYPSSSNLDDLAWAGVWLYQATGEFAVWRAICAVPPLNVAALHDRPASVHTPRRSATARMQDASSGVPGTSSAQLYSAYVVSYCHVVP